MKRKFIDDPLRSKVEIITTNPVGCCSKMDFSVTMIVAQFLIPNFVLFLQFFYICSLAKRHSYERFSKDEIYWS